MNEKESNEWRGFEEESYAQKEYDKEQAQLDRYENGGKCDE